MSEPRTTRKRRPALTPESRETQLISLADDMAEEQLRSGTASAQVLTHFLKLGSTRNRLEEEKIRNENLLISARLEQIASSQRIEQMYEDALNAMRSYSGQQVEVYDEEGFDENVY